MSLPPRPILIQRVLWLSVILGIVTISMSMVMHGWTSLFLSPATFGLTIAFDATLLGLSLRERQSASSDSSSDTLKIPATCRTATTFLSVFLATLWTAAFLLSIIIVALDISFSSWMDDQTRLLPATYVEIAFMFFQILTLVWLSVISSKERQALRKEYYDTHPHAIPALTKVDINLDSPQTRWIRRLVLVSVLLCGAVLGLSVGGSYGFATIYISIAAVALTWAWCGTVLVLSAKERRERAVNPSTEAPSTEAVDGETTYPPKQTQQTPFSRLPCTSRKPTIICGYILIIVWAAAFVTSVLLNYWRFSPSSYLDFSDDNINATVAWVELGFITPVFILVTVITVLCVRERKRVLGQQQELKWWHLGVYRA